MKSLEQHPRFILLLSRLLISHLSASSSRGLPTIRHLSGICQAPKPPFEAAATTMMLEDCIHFVLVCFGRLLVMSVHHGLW